MEVDSGKPGPPSHQEEEYQLRRDKSKLQGSTGISKLRVMQVILLSIFGPRRLDARHTSF